ncbi:putative Ig domain-containing protein [Thermus filiformis]|uniref:putative Ig domain-containing protein n=1 Tax=Thermus filiformis TaxID=276 RepID=UPI000530F746|nr:putative Ig domain-containing protein [Thermus filiformis]
MRRLLLLALLLAACGSQDLSLTEPLRVSATLPPAYLGEAYGAQVAAEGGVRPYTYTLEGRLPQGLSFQGGRFSGVPKEKGSFSLVLTVEDGAKNSRAQKLTLTVQDPPPPRLVLVLPPAEVEGEFILLARLEGREALGFQAELTLKDLEADLSSLKPAPGVYLLYRREGEGVRLEAAFARPLKGAEVFRLTLRAAKPTRPQLPLKAVFYDKEGKPLGQPLPERGLGFKALLDLAQSFGKKGEGLAADRNGDGAVDEKDLALLQEAFAVPPAGGSSEPTQSADRMASTSSGR